MNAERFDLLAQGTVGAGSRRAVLRAAAGVAAGLIAGGDRRLDGRAADPAPPLPPPSMDPWPVCTGERTHYCVAAFSVDEVDQLAASEPGYALSVIGDGAFPDSEVATRLVWGVWSPGQDPLSVLGVDDEIVLRVRAGRLHPVVTHAVAKRLRMRVDGDATSGWEVEVRGRPGLIAFRDGLDSEQAGVAQSLFGGTGFDRTGGEVQLWGGFEGYIATTATEFAPPRWVGDGWNIFLGGPHWMPDGSVNVGGYEAWIAAGSLQRLGLSPDEAAAGGLAVTRIDQGIESTVGAAISVLDGGVLIENAELPFSRPTIAIRRRGGRGCAKRCRKGRVCQKGRCVKKGKGRGKHR